MSLKDKNIIIGITGGIAAYKIPLLVRMLKKAEANVQILMTPDAHNFVAPLTLSVLSGRPVLTDFVHNETGEWNNHVAWGEWADVLLFAPVTAHTLGKMAHGLADNLLMAVYLSAKSPVMIAPAMDLDMYAHPSTTANLQQLKSYGHIIIPATKGELASGLTGYGRMEEPENIFEQLRLFFEKKKTLSGKKFLITAGPTYEAIDPVRFIGNHSSGKMGIALAEEAAERGAEVILILGPTHLQANHPNIKTIRVQSASEMYEAVHRYFSQADIAIMAAAVADFTPETRVEHKIKKTGDKMQLHLKSTRDILASLGKIKKPQQILIGFAMETQNEQENARKKLEKKNLDFIVLNSLNEKKAGFKYDTNKVSLFFRDGRIQNYPLKSKRAVAGDILDALSKL